MSRNPVRTAIELVDTTPSNEFLSTLHARLLAEFDRSDPPATESTQEYVTLVPNASHLDQSLRLVKTLLAAAACVAVFAAGAMTINRAGDDSNALAELHDVDQQEALPLAKRALITDDALGVAWQIGPTWDESALPIQAAATIIALPECALLSSAGLVPPTTKSATDHRFVLGNDFLFQRVYVFATPQDASRAMDVIASDVFPTCWFNLFDRLTPYWLGVNATATTEAEDAPQIASHGDRQVIFGQNSTVVRPGGGPFERHLVNVFVQVGRAISWINPRVIAAGDVFAVNKAITATTGALTAVFGH